MNLFQSKYFNILLPIIFICLILFSYHYGHLLGITNVPTLIANAVLLLVSTLIAISLPLYASFKNKQEQKDHDTKMVIVTISRYVGNEILDNVIEIEDIIDNNKMSEKQLKSQTMLSTEAENMVTVGIWRVASKELVVSLEDKQHQSIVQSGLIAKIESSDMADGIRFTYQKLDNLIKRLRRLSKLCDILLSPPGKTPNELFDNQLNIQVTKGVKAVEKDIEIFNNEAEITIKAINKFLKPYGKEIKID